VVDELPALAQLRGSLITLASEHAHHLVALAAT
jgi:hypothetical protein